ncbi:MAG: thioredoxin family protein [Coriobacteriia bacterium]|nr:thioredoxin family protein [Coriobacteriia bacterium]
MRPVVAGLKPQYAGKVEFKDMNTDSGDAQVNDLANRFGIQYVPTFVFVNADGTKSGLIVGEVPKEKLMSELAKLK